MAGGKARRDAEPSFDMKLLAGGAFATATGHIVAKAGTSAARSIAPYGMLARATLGAPAILAAGAGGIARQLGIVAMVAAGGKMVLSSAAKADDGRRSGVDDRSIGMADKWTERDTRDVISGAIGQAAIYGGWSLLRGAPKTIGQAAGRLAAISAAHAVSSRIVDSVIPRAKADEGKSQAQREYKPGDTVAGGREWTASKKGEANSWAGLGFLSAGAAAALPLFRPTPGGFFAAAALWGLSGASNFMSFRASDDVKETSTAADVADGNGSLAAARAADRDTPRAYLNRRAERSSDQPPAAVTTQAGTLGNSGQIVRSDGMTESYVRRDGTSVSGYKTPKRRV